MDLNDFEHRLEIYRQALREKAKPLVICDAWTDLLASAISLQGPVPPEPSKEVAAAYAARDARVAKNEARDFYAIDQTMDDWVEALESFVRIVRTSG